MMMVPAFWAETIYGDLFHPNPQSSILAKNYSDVMPLIFGKWDYLKNNPRIDVYQLYDLANVKYNSRILMNDAISANCKYSIAFNTFDGEIALAFYSRNIKLDSKLSQLDRKS